ncbi:phosphatidylinositol N-acetylglucosaminyltransferase subunit C [Chytriomyces cf. hyalinus JEL632]|nr:phosphatidylinositol N-acetylglucosaminyltransferase subunit C [Chytriomyces cf. hyalinus JEL632]
MRRSQSNSSVPARISPQILYDPTNGGLPDSHVSPLFLVNMRRNENVKTHSYWPLVGLTAVVTQQLAAVVLFVGVFAQLFADSNEYVEAIYPMDGMQPLHNDAHPHYTTPPRPSFLVTHPWHVTAFGMLLSSAGAVLVLSRKLNNANETTTRDHPKTAPQPHIWRRVMKVSKGGVLLAFILLALTPILRTLTKDTSDDTIWALSSFLFAANLLFCDYSSNSLTTVRYPDSFSINAAVFASVLLASRLNENAHVFSLMCFSIETFALFPILRRSLRALWKPNDVIMASLLACASLWSVSLVSASMAYVYAVTLVFVTFVCPLWFLGVQKYKDEIRGPWDEAKPIFRGVS